MVETASGVVGVPVGVLLVRQPVTHLVVPGGAAELRLSPLGGFITMTVGPKTLVGRYSPPRLMNGRLKEESWNLTPDLDTFPVSDGKRTIKLFLYNNEKAGSKDPYHLASIELHYRAFE